MNTSSSNLLADPSTGAMATTPIQTRTVFRAGSNVSNQGNNNSTPKEHAIINITYAESIEIELLVTKGMSREQAIKVYFDSRPDKKFDPNASYNMHALDFEVVASANTMPLTEVISILHLSR